MVLWSTISWWPLLLWSLGVSSSSVGVSATVLMPLTSGAGAAGAAAQRANRNKHSITAASVARREKNRPIMAFLPPGWLDPEHNRNAVGLVGVGRSGVRTTDLGPEATNPQVRCYVWG